MSVRFSWGGKNKFGGRCPHTPTPWLQWLLVWYALVTMLAFVIICVYVQCVYMCVYVCVCIRISCSSSGIRATTAGKWRHPRPRDLLCSGPDLNPISPCSVKMLGLSHKFQISQYGVQSLHLTQLNSSSIILKLELSWVEWRTRECRAAPSEHFNVATRHIMTPHRNCCTAVRHSLACGTFFLCPLDPLFVSPLSMLSVSVS